jgi:hypothetical protein
LIPSLLASAFNTVIASRFGETIRRCNPLPPVERTAMVQASLQMWGGSFSGGSRMQADCFASLAMTAINGSGWWFFE